MADYQGDPYGAAQNGAQTSVGPAQFNPAEQGYSVGANSAEDHIPRADDHGAGGGPSGGAGQVQQPFSPQGYGSGLRAPSSGPPPGMGGTAFVPGKIFLGGLANTTTKDQLESYCAQWGEMSDIVLMEGRGFGFVTYADPQCAQAFLEKKDHELDHKKIEAKAAVPKNAGGSSGLTRKMFVGGTGELGEDEFRSHFAQFGDIEDSVILRKPDGTSRGFGFVTYRDESMVEKCLVVQHVISGKTVEVKRAVKKEDMAAGAGYDQSYAARTGKAPDWHCPECRNKNFGWREVCNRCQAAKPMIAGGGMGMMATGMMGGMRSNYGGDGSYMGGNMGMGGMGAIGMGGMGTHSMGMANMGNMSPQMAEMGGMSGMSGYGGMGGMGQGQGLGSMGHMGGYQGVGGGRGGMGGYGSMQGKMSPQMAAGSMGGVGGMGGNYGSGGGYGQMQQGTGYGPAYSEGSAGYDMSGGQAAGGYNGGAGAGGAYGGGAGYGGGQGVASAYGGNAGYGANAAATYGDGSAGYGQQGSYGRAAPGRGSMSHARYRPY